MLKVYGAPFSRAGRAVWMAEELGQPYELISKDPRTGETRSAEMLALNPNGHVPVVEDGDFVIWESMAINLYLAQKYDTLWPAGLEDQAHASQWSFWVMTEVEPPLIAILMNSMFLPEEQRDASAVTQGMEQLKAPMAVLNGALEGRDYLLGSEFSVADLNVCAVLGFAHYVQYDFSPYPNVAAWLQRCAARPGHQKMSRIAQEAMAG